MITSSCAMAWCCTTRCTRGASMCARRPTRGILSVRRRERPNKRSEEHTSEIPSLMRTSYAVLCLKKTKHLQQTINTENLNIYTILRKSSIKSHEYRHWIEPNNHPQI